MKRSLYVHNHSGEVFMLVQSSPRILLVGLTTGRRRMPRPSTLARAYTHRPDLS